MEADSMYVRFTLAIAIQKERFVKTESNKYNIEKSKIAKFLYAF